MSRRDLAHVMAALSRLSARDETAVIPTDAVDEAIGRGRGDLRTALDLDALVAAGHVVAREGGWSLTPNGLDWLAEQDELSTQ